MRNRIHSTERLKAVDAAGRLLMLRATVEPNQLRQAIENSGDRRLAMLYRTATPATGLDALGDTQAQNHEWMIASGVCGMADRLYEHGAVLGAPFGIAGSLVVASGHTAAQGAIKAIGTLDFDEASLVSRKAIAIVILTRSLMDEPDFPRQPVENELRRAATTAQDAEMVAALSALYTPIASGDDAREDVATILTTLGTTASSKVVYFLGKAVWAQYQAMSESERPAALKGVAYALDGIASTTIVAIDATAVVFRLDTIILRETRGDVQLSDAPTPGATTLTSLWQNGCVGLVCERELKFSVTRDNSCVILTGADWSAP